jgi:hypothetical protein
VTVVAEVSRRELSISSVLTIALSYRDFIRS